MSLRLGSTLITGLANNRISNAHTLLDFKWSDHKINSMEWLRSDTFSWQSGLVYIAAYNHLTADLSSATESTETVGSYTITVYTATDGHKIVLADQADVISNIFKETGTAWYYIIDTTNKQFKLPRTSENHGNLIKSYKNGYDWYRIYEDGWCEQGRNVTSESNGWQNCTCTLLVPYLDVNYHVSITSSWAGNGDGASYYYANSNKTTTSFAANLTNYSSSYGYATWKASGYTTNYTSFNGHKYLYFYVGEYTQSAIEQSAGLSSELLNSKVDIDCLVEGNIVIESYANSGSWYRIYSDGWIEQGGRGSLNEQASTQFALIKAFSDTNYFICASQYNISTAGDAEMGVGANPESTTTFRAFCHYINPNTMTFMWYACGY